jgi:hypothetical protein
MDKIAWITRAYLLIRHQDDCVLRVTYLFLLADGAPGILSARVAADPRAFQVPYGSPTSPAACAGYSSTATCSSNATAVRYTSPPGPGDPRAPRRDPHRGLPRQPAGHLGPANDTTTDPSRRLDRSASNRRHRRPRAFHATWTSSSGVSFLVTHSADSVHTPLFDTARSVSPRNADATRRRRHHPGLSRSY